MRSSVISPVKLPISQLESQPRDDNPDRFSNAGGREHERRNPKDAQTMLRPRKRTWPDVVRRGNGHRAQRGYRPLGAPAGTREAAKPIGQGDQIVSIIGVRLHQLANRRPRIRA